MAKYQNLYNIKGAVNDGKIYDGHFLHGFNEPIRQLVPNISQIFKGLGILHEKTGNYMSS